MNWRQKWINPVLEKEFRLRMRSPRSSAAVLSYLVSMTILAFGFIYMNMSYDNTFNSQQSRDLFYFISGAQLVLICFMVPSLTAGVISGEREKQTLNILLTTQQSSTTIILSKLLSSLSFMLVIVIVTLPIYSVVFLFGGIAPSTLISVFAFYIFYMLVVGAVGIYFSTIFKKTMVSVIMTYGFVAFICGFTGLAAIFSTTIFNQSGGRIAGLLLGVNPLGALISVFDAEFSRQVFGSAPHVELWQIFIPFYSVIGVLAIVFSIRSLRPIARK